MSRNFLYYKPSKLENGQLLEFDAANVRLHPPVAKQGNTKMIEPYYLHNGVAIALKFQTPQMYTPFELDYPRFGEENKKKGYKQFSMSFANEEPEGDLASFRQFLDAIDNAVIKILYANNAEWFGGRGRKPVTRDIIEHQYGYIVKSGINEKKQIKYPDNVVVKCNVRGGMLVAAFFDDESRIIMDESDINMAQGEAIAVLHYASLWVVQGYHPRIEAVQTQLFPNETIDRTFGIVESPDSGGEGPKAGVVFVE